MNNDLPYFWTALGLYGGATASYGGFLALRRPSVARFASVLIAVAFAVLTIGQVVRWRLDGYFPISNMHEYLRFLTWTVSLVYLGLVVIKMRENYTGAFVAPIAFGVLLIAAIFPKQIQPQLMPALQSYWIKIHVPCVVFGTGAFATAFASGMLYLFRAYDPSGTKPDLPRAMRTQGVIAAAAGLALSATILAVTHYHTPDAVFYVCALSGLALLLGYPIFWLLVWVRLGDQDDTGLIGHTYAVSTLALLLGAAITAMLRTPQIGFLQAPEKKTLLLPFFGATAIIGLLLHVPLDRFVTSLRHRLPSEDTLDEVNYRAASIGYPVFGIGTAFGAMWAYSAWGRAWGFDPKEVGALIVFLIYTVYMHGRLARDWRGRKTAVVGMMGFLAALFTLFGNTFLGGLHSYAG